LKTLLFSILVFSSFAVADIESVSVTRSSHRVCSKWLLSNDLPYVVYDPPSGTAVLAQWFFLPGFADEPKNHDAFFKGLARNGIRVVSMTYPSHGEASGAPLGFYTFRSLLRKAVLPLMKAALIPGIPYLIGGWSTGAVMSEYLVRGSLLKDFVGSSPSGVIEIALGLPVRLVPGNWLAQVTPETLSSREEPAFWQGVSIRPSSPYLHPLFSATLAIESFLLRKVPAGRERIPTLVLSAGKKDAYVQAEQTHQLFNRLSQLPQSRIQVVQFPEAKHAIQWEPNERRQLVRSVNEFILSTVQ
jgi:alpha-beta hydrolase superfamily lysophospholipase